ncbi:MAG: hypothetical protein M1814_004403, partial [Vezdaea aestivalis]
RSAIPATTTSANIPPLSSPSPEVAAPVVVAAAVVLDAVFEVEVVLTTDEVSEETVWEPVVKVVDITGAVVVMFAPLTVTKLIWAESGTRVLSAA